ncbi:MAG: DUF222 domain-containing protein [Acidimicrobiia bacterium]
MFDLQDTIELLSGESHDDDKLYQLTREVESTDWVEPERHVLPAVLEDLPPGPYLSAITASVDRTKLNGYDAVRLMRVEARLSSHHDAGKLATMVEVAHSPAGDRDAPVVRDVEELEYAAFEIGSALTLTRRGAERELDLALSLAGKLRQVWEKFRRGLIDMRRVKVFDSQLGHLSSDTIEAVSEKVLDRAEGLTTGQLQARLARGVMETDPKGADVGYEEGLADRRLATYANPDGTANQCVYSIAPDDAAAVSRRVNRLALALKNDTEPRTIDQLRADVFVDLLLARAKSIGADRGVVHLNVDVATLAELSNAPGELAGYGPVVADIARKVASGQTGATWQFSVTDNDGNLIASDVTRRRPTAAMKREIESEYRTCVAPGCRMPACDCDLDHRRPYSRGGPTHNDNMGPLCRYHHMAKHHAPWSLERLPNGDHSWTSPLSHVYIRARAPPR